MRDLRPLGQQLLELLRSVRHGDRRVEDQALLGALLRVEDGMFEDELADLWMPQHLPPDPTRGDLVELPPFAELRARLLERRDQVLEVGVADVTGGLGAEASDQP